MPTIARARAAATRASLHAFWADDVTLLDPKTVDVTGVHGSRQLTDASLLALATRRGGRFVTFDQHIARAAVPNAQPDNLLVL